MRTTMSNLMKKDFKKITEQERQLYEAKYE